MRLCTRIFVACGLVMLLLGAGVAVALEHRNRVRCVAKEAKSAVKKGQTISRLQLAVSLALMPINDYLITGRKLEYDNFLRLIKDTDLLLSHVATMELGADEGALLQSILADYARLKAMGRKILEIPKPTGSHEEAILMKEIDAVGNQLITQLFQLNVSMDKAVALRHQKREHELNSSTHLFVAIVVAVAGVVLVFGAQLSRRIVAPMQVLEGAFGELAAANWDRRIEQTTGTDFDALFARFNSMAAAFAEMHHTLERESDSRTRQIDERVAELTTLLETSAALSATFDMDQLLARIAETMTRSLGMTYCRIALVDSQHSDPVIRAAFPVRTLDWEPGIGRVLEPEVLPDLQTAFATLRHVVLSHDVISSPERSVEQRHLFTTATQSGLLLPLILNDVPEGVIVLGELREGTRAPISEEKIRLCQTMANQSIIAIANARNYADLQQMFLSVVTAMASAIDAKSPWTRGHSERMTRHAVAIGKKLGLGSVELRNLRLGCTMHDIGKIGTSETILDKPGKLTEEEFACIRRHPLDGAKILGPIQQFQPILSVVRHHHERFDGTGYPDGLLGEEIPLLARIAAVADTYDAMTADRPYRDGISAKEAKAEIRRFSGKQFDPLIADTFVSMLDEGYR